LPFAAGGAMMTVGSGKEENSVARMRCACLYCLEY
jgi:hypothetical protein